MIPTAKLLQSFTRNDTIQDWTRCETGIAVQSSRQQLHSDVFASTDMHTQCLQDNLKGSAIPVCVCVGHEYTSLVRAVLPFFGRKRTPSVALCLPFLLPAGRRETVAGKSDS